MNKYIKFLLWLVVIAAALTCGLYFGSKLRDTFGPIPLREIHLIVKRKDNDKYQVIFTSFDTKDRIGYDKFYIIMYNPTVSSNPSETTFDTYVAARTYYSSTYKAETKAYSPLSSTTVNNDFNTIEKIN